MMNPRNGIFCHAIAIEAVAHAAGISFLEDVAWIGDDERPLKVVLFERVEKAGEDARIREAHELVIEGGKDGACGSALKRLRHPMLVDDLAAHAVIVAEDLDVRMNVLRARDDLE